MQKHIAHGKLSKKMRRQADAQRRGTWGAISPVTRRPPNPKAYDRNKARKWRDEHSVSAPFPYSRYQ